MGRPNSVLRLFIRYGTFVHSFMGGAALSAREIPDLTDFQVDSNRGMGALPASSISAMSAVTTLNINHNGFRGSLPERGLEAMRLGSSQIRAVIFFMVSDNKLGGALPESGLAAMSAVGSFQVGKNIIAGTLPGRGLQVMSGVNDFIIYKSAFSGTLPGIGLAVMCAVTNFVASENHLTGSFPDGSQAMSHVQRFYIWGNNLEGILPASGLAVMSEVVIFQANENKLAGALPQRGLRGMSSVQTFYLHLNAFKGQLPERGLQAMSTVTEFSAHTCSFRGAIPGIGFQGMNGLRNFVIHTNGFAGALPGRGLHVMSGVDDFVMYINALTGTLPESGLSAMRAVTNFMLSQNRFAGTLPGGARAMRSVQAFVIWGNTFDGTLPAISLAAMRAVTNFEASTNRLQGALPERGLRAMSGVKKFLVNENAFKGQLPGKGLEAMSEVTNFLVNENHLTGSVPDGSQAMSNVQVFSIWQNNFEGTLPAVSLAAMRKVTDFEANTNRLQGALPERGLRAMRRLKYFIIGENAFAGTLPASGLAAMRKVTGFFAFDNSFAGALPERGLRAMSRINMFAILANRFAGALPERGLASLSTVTLFSALGNSFTGVVPDHISMMQAVTHFWINQNRFTGTLPTSGLAAMSLAEGGMDVSDNYFEGSIPKWLNAVYVSISHNLLAGSIPEDLLSSRDPMHKMACATGVFLQGTIPQTSSRMTMKEIILSLGHGLLGAMPSLPGTVHLLSLWENSLEGHLPELHIKNMSVLLVHANDFSCKLPRNEEVELDSTTLALVGNYFAQSRHIPAWITSAERPTDMFCVSNRHLIHYVMFLTSSGCIFLVTAFLSAGRLRAGYLYGRFASARLAWYETSQESLLLFVTSCMLLPLCSNQLSRACTMVTDHLRLHFIATTRPAEACLMALVHVWTWQLCRGFHRRHATQISRVGVAPTTPPTASGLRRRKVDRLAVTRVYSAWFFVCVLLSAPGVLYAMAKAVPGFLQVSMVWKWIIGNVVAVFSGLVTGVGLEFLAEKVGGPTRDEATLQLVGLQVASLLLPGLATVLYHAECLGAWTSFWGARNETWYLDPALTPNYDPAHARAEYQAYKCRIELLSKSDISSLRWHMERRACMEAVSERLAWLLFPKLANYIFTMTAFRMLRAYMDAGGRMTLKAASVLLSYTWLVAVLFGPSLPILNALVALLAKIYSVLLFGPGVQLVDIENQEESGSVVSFGFSSVTVLVLLLQANNLPSQ